MLPITPAISIQQSITEQLNKKCNQNTILKGKSLKTLENKGFEALLQLFEFGVSLVVINYISLSFVQIHTIFYFNYIIYSGLLIFCCQNVATITSLLFRQLLSDILKSFLH